MKLADWLNQENLSAAEFGRKIGVSRQNVARWAAGMVPRHDEMLAIVQATGGVVTPNDFFGVNAPNTDSHKTEVAG